MFLKYKCAINIKNITKNKNTYMKLVIKSLLN